MVSVTLWMRAAIARTSPLSLIDRRGHLQRDARAGAECVVHTDDVVLKVSDLVIHEVDKGDGLCVAEGFLQLHLLGGVHRFAELPAQLVQDFRHTEELIIGVREAEAQVRRPSLPISGTPCTWCPPRCRSLWLAAYPE